MRDEQTATAACPYRDDAYFDAVNRIIIAAHVLRGYDLDLEDREAMRAALRRAKVLR